MKIQVTVSHVLDLPDDAELVSGPGEFDGFRLAGVYIAPKLDYLQSSNIDSPQVQFAELGESIKDEIKAALVQENITIARKEWP